MIKFTEEQSDEEVHTWHKIQKSPKQGSFCPSGVEVRHPPST